LSWTANNAWSTYPDDESTGWAKSVICYNDAPVPLSKDGISATGKRHRSISEFNVCKRSPLNERIGNKWGR
ncbi:MAG: hypothetical protein H7258_07990, partial [Ferruginibacter sp.]|nr:hypothetical protein [Ferruginibacter sp.]